MSVFEIYRCARSLEAIENYALANIPAIEETEIESASDIGDLKRFESDKMFWNLALNNQFPWGTKCYFYKVAVSEWVARVPGLFWSEGSEALRKLANNAIQYRSETWQVYEPLGKSQKVLGGVGTLKLPPDKNGWRLITISGGHNASCGIPVLVSPDVWNFYKLEEGSVISLRATWQQMPVDWAKRFQSIKGIPRGNLVLGHPDQVQEAHYKGPTEFHPFTVMEYSKGDATLFDFVYATADTAFKGYRKKLEQFFENYKNDRGRYGRYLLSADIGDPMWDAEYDSPESLRDSAGNRAHLELLQARVRELSFKGKSLETIQAVLARDLDPVSLKRISDSIGLPPALWFVDGAAPSNLAARLLGQSLVRNKVEELVDAIALEYPALFLKGE